MINYEYADLFKTDNVDKQFIIATDDGAVTIKNVELHSEQFELNESICSDNSLRFGACEASSVKFRMSNVFTSLKGKWTTVSATLGGNTDNPFVFGRYKVNSDKPTADRRYRDVVAYDAMYDILSADVAEWYNSLTFPMPLKTFRKAFISHFNLEEVEISLINDEMVVERTIEPSELSGRDVITAICELNGCFGHIGRDGKFHYIILQEITRGLYPSDTLYPANDLFPQGTGNTERISKSKYMSATYQDFITQKITKVQVRQEENDIGAIVGTDGNTYIIEDNFLVYGKSATDLETIANNILLVIKVVTYRPSSIKAIGNPCIEVGDAIRVSTKYQMIETYVLKRTIKGIQGLKDTYDIKGVEQYGNNVNSVQRSIVQLKGKTNLLIRTVEETRLEMSDIEKGLSTQIKVNAEGLLAEAKRATEAEGKLQSSYKQLAGEIVLKVDANGNLVTVSLSAEASTGSNFTVSADNIDLSGKTINLTSDNISIESTNFSVDEEGNVTATSGNFSGIITCGVGSSVGGFKTDSNSLFKGNWGTSTPDVFMCTGSTGIYTLGGHTSSGWVFGAGNDFGVTDDGGVYCNNLNAEGGSIGGFTITETSLTSGEMYISSDGSAVLGEMTILGGISAQGTGRFDEIYITGSQDFWSGWSLSGTMADVYNKLDKINAIVEAY